MNYLFSFFLLSLSLHFSSCYGQLTPHVEPRINIAVDSNRYYRNEISGYRIQIGLHGDKSVIDSLKIKFANAYPKIDSYVSFEPPNFKLMVGDFRTEIEADLLKQHIQGLYPLAIVQRTKIKLPRID